MNGEPRIRAFVAVELDGAVKEVLAGLIDGLRKAGLVGLRLVEPEAVHLTLKFLGDVPETVAEAIPPAIGEAVRGLRPFDLATGDTGVFPSRGAPRVLWIGLNGDLAQLLDLHRRLEEALEPLGFARERRPYRPHLTLGRLRERASSTERRRAAEALSSMGPCPGTPIAVRAVSLMRSVLLPAGAEYSRLSRVPLTSGMPW